jgi:hypothetical protein
MDLWRKDTAFLCDRQASLMSLKSDIRKMEAEHLGILRQTPEYKHLGKEYRNNLGLIRRMLNQMESFLQDTSVWPTPEEATVYNNLVEIEILDVEFAKQRDILDGIEERRTELLDDINCHYPRTPHLSIIPDFEHWTNKRPRGV